MGLNTVVELLGIRVYLYVCAQEFIIVKVICGASLPAMSEIP